MALYTEPYDTADYLNDKEDIIAYLAEAAESDDEHIIAVSLATVARARGGMSQLAKETGISEAVLAKALGQDGNPDLSTMLKILKALGVKITFLNAA